MTVPPPALSVIVPTWNRALLLEGCLASVASQAREPGVLELVVVDDGSTDATGAVVRRAAEAHRDVPVRLVRSAHGGTNSARNAGVRNSGGDLLCFVDDDTEMREGWLSGLVEGADRYPDVGVFAGRIMLRLEARPPRTCGREPLGETHLDLGEQDRESDVAWGACMMVRRGVLDRVGPFDESIPTYETETEWVDRYKTSGGRIVYLASAGVWHRRTADSLRPSSLLGRSFRFGRGWAVASRVTGRRCSVAGALAAAIRGFAHGVGSRCFVGFRNASSALGVATEAARMLVSRGGSSSISWLPAPRR